MYINTCHTLIVKNQWTLNAELQYYLKNSWQNILRFISHILASKFSLKCESHYFLKNKMALTLKMAPPTTTTISYKMYQIRYIYHFLNKENQTSPGMTLHSILTLSMPMCISRDLDKMSIFFMDSLLKSSQTRRSSTHLGLMESTA